MKPLKFREIVNNPKSIVDIIAHGKGIMCNLKMRTVHVPTVRQISHQKPTWYKEHMGEWSPNYSGIVVDSVDIAGGVTLNILYAYPNRGQVANWIQYRAWLDPIIIGVRDFIRSKNHIDLPDKVVRRQLLIKMFTDRNLWISVTGEWE